MLISNRANERNEIPASAPSKPKIIALCINDKATGITVEPDAKYPAMYRVRGADGTLSDMVNLSRAKDSALSWLAEARGRGLSLGEAARWVIRERRSRRGTAIILSRGYPATIPTIKTCRGTHD